MNLEDQHEQQEIDRQNQFTDWFYGKEIQGNATAAVHFLAEQIGRLSSMDNLMDAYFYVQPKQKTTHSILLADDDDLPF